MPCPGRLKGFVTTLMVLSLFRGLTDVRGQSVYASPHETRTIAGVAPVARTRAVEGAPFGFPAAVAVDQQGSVFVADGEAGSPVHGHAIWKLSPTGVATLLAGSPGISGAVDGPGNAARFNDPSGIAVDRLGNVYVSDFQNHTIRKISRDGTVTTLAGLAGVSGTADGVGATARFNAPLGVAADEGGNLFVADANSSTIRKVTPAGLVTTFAGVPGSFGPGRAGEFRRPYGVTVDRAGNVYVSDHIDTVIRKITPAGQVTTLAGTSGFTGATDGTGSAARFVSPFGVAADTAGNLFVADRGNHTIRRVTPDGVVTTVAGLAPLAGSRDGSGMAARFNAPYGLAVDNAGNIYVTDTFNTLVRRIDASGVVTTFAGVLASNGSVDGSGDIARFNEPYGVAVDEAGAIFVADRFNHTVRRISTTGVVTTVAGSAGEPGSADGIASAARFSNPMGLTIDRMGNLYIADSGNGTIRKLTNGVVTTIAGTAGMAGNQDGVGGAARFFQPQAIALDGAGNLYIADTLNTSRFRTSAIRKLAPTGIVTTLAQAPLGTGAVTPTETGFNSATGIAIDAAGTIYFVDMLAMVIRRLNADGTTTTFAGMPGRAGSSDGSGADARFNVPFSLAIDLTGNLIVADWNNHTLRRITPTGRVTTLAGAPGIFGGRDGVGSTARVSGPRGVAVDRTGAIYVADTFNNTIRKLTPAAATVAVGRLINLSARGTLQPGGSLTAGFVMKGAGAKHLMIRGIGPTLRQFGVGDAMNDPKLDLIHAGTVSVASNDDWLGLPVTARLADEVGAFPLTSEFKDAALQGAWPVSPGGYSSRVSGPDDTASGTVLAEIYDADPLTAEASLVNLSALGFAGTGESFLVVGFVIGGSLPKRILIRAVGPGLGPFGVARTLLDPRIEVHKPGMSTVVAANDNWSGTPELDAGFTEAGAFKLEVNSRDAALIGTFVPGAYTVIASGVDGTTGNVLIEVYDLDP
jgi:sugar lactone lactonase YvrE